MDFSFSKNEKLCSKKNIQTVFEKGEKFTSYPFFFVYILSNEPVQTSVKVLISVSKKKFKRAVDRNRIKRLCRESYRLNKNILYDNMNEKAREVHLTIHYIANTELPFDTIHKNMQKALTQLVNEVNKNFG